jgi:hypothetical protein
VLLGAGGDDDDAVPELLDASARLHLRREGADRAFDALDLLALSRHRSPRRLKDDLAPYKVNKGTIRFPLSEPVPVKLIERIAKFRAKEAAERARAKLAAPKKR